MSRIYQRRRVFNFTRSTNRLKTSTFRLFMVYSTGGLVATSVLCELFHGTNLSGWPCGRTSDTWKMSSSRQGQRDLDARKKGRTNCSSWVIEPLVITVVTHFLLSSKCFLFCLCVSFLVLKKKRSKFFVSTLLKY